MDDLFLSVGDLSAANYVVNILKHLKEKPQTLNISGITDKRMEELGVKSIANIKDLNLVGIVEVLPKIFKIKKIIKHSLEAANNSRWVILCDAPGFNFRLMKNLKHNNIIYFISPQVWAWKPQRIKEIVNYVKHLIVILPFELDIYKPYENKHFKVHYFGHPLLDIIKPSSVQKENIIAMLPGSRNSEFKRHIGLLEEVAYFIYKNFHMKSLIPVASTVDYPIYSKDYIETTKESSLDVMKKAKFGIIASGTASLEASLIGLPHVIFYRLNPITLHIAKHLVKSKYIGLPNIIMNKEIIPELIQPSKKDIVKKVSYYLENPKNLEDMKESLKLLREKLSPENATQKIADFIYDVIIKSG
ncbi:lipid-A-disaccharide synthase [Hydrogenobaculum acidophilum]